MYDISFVAFVLVLGLEQGLSIRCYECNSQNNSMCLDPTIYDEETRYHFLPVVECAHGVYTNGNHEFFCRKIVQSIFHKGYESEVRVMRSCGWVKHHRECYKADNEDHLETVCQCFNDECNGTSKVYASAILVGLLGVKLWL